MRRREMAWIRLHKSVRLFPGLRLNFSRSGVSVSAGGSPATVNVSNKGVRTTVTVPGTGVSVVDQRKWGKK